MTAFSVLLKSGSIWFSAFVCSGVLGAFIAWSALAPLAEGVIAYGQISVENNRKTIQHLEGGMIQEVLVQEGGYVDKGQPLLILTDTVVASGRNQIVFELANAQAAIDRLTALSSGHLSIEFDRLSALTLDEAIQLEIEERQGSLFAQQKTRLEADVTVLEGRKNSLAEQTDALDLQLENNQDAIDYIALEISRNKRLLDTQLIRASELAALERDKIRLQSERARLNTERTRTQNRMVEIEQEAAQILASHNEELSRELVEARRQSTALREQLEAAQDAVNRTTIVAPQSGEVLNLKFTTAGGVVKPGEPILEIVPANTDLIAIVNIRPVDRDTVFEGLEVDARLSSTSSWHAALYSGTINGISADLKTSPDGSASYYEARVSLNKLKSENIAIQPMPGMPVEAFVYSGRHRTFLEYLTEPLLAAFRRGGRE